jgi:hypothetical protein
VAAAPTRTSSAALAQSGDVAGAEAIWWNTEVSSNQWRELDAPATTSMSSDQAMRP